MDWLVHWYIHGEAYTVALVWVVTPLTAAAIYLLLRNYDLGNHGKDR